jgi:teichuronic acid biosynthesis glycosyltransferase TuaH
VKILAFPYHDWRKGQVEGMRWRDGHLLEVLGAHPEVAELLVVDRPVSRVERLLRRAAPTVGGDRIAERSAGRFGATLTRVADRTTVLDMTTPDLLAPIRRRYRWWFDIFARPEVIELVRWGSDRLLGPRPAAIVWMPTVGPPIDAVKPSRLVFDSLDNWLLHPQLRRYADAAEEGYARLLPRADAILVSAPRSRDALQRWAEDIEIVPNGVSPHQFAGTVQRPSDLPQTPIVGYAGSLGPRIDTALVVEVARQLPHVTFAFIGQALDRTTVRALQSSANVLVLGDRHYSEVPAYVRSFDVAWIPHAIGAGESGGDPIKMYEYWAAGREVVTTPIDGLDRWRELLHFARTPEEAVTTISGLLGGSLRPKQATVPEDRTWEAIAERIVGHLRGTEASA